MNDKTNKNFLEQSSLKKGLGINDFNKPEQQLIKELSEGCKMEEEEVIRALLDNENLSAGTKATLLEKGNLKILNISPEFYKQKTFNSLNLLPHLEEFYLSEDYRKTRENRIKKINLSNCSSLKALSIRACRLVELSIDSPNLHTLVLRAPMLKKYEFHNLAQLKDIQLDGIPVFDINKLNPKWNLLETLSIIRMSQDIPIEELTNIQRLTLDYLKDISIASLDGKKISLEAPNLELVDLVNTNIKELHLDKCPKLKALLLTEKNMIKATFDYKIIEKLDLNLGWQFLSADKLNECEQLKELRLVDYCGLTLKIQLEKLHTIYLIDPEIKTLDVTSCHELRKLNFIGKSVEIDHLKTHCDYLELKLHNTWIKTLDISASLDSAYLEYNIFGIDTNRIKLICRDTQLERHEWLRKDFSNIKTIISSGEDLEQMVDSYNYDQGNAFLEWIIEHPNCDKGTALKMHWSLGVGWYSQYEDESQIPSHAKEGYKLIKKIEELYTSDYIKKSEIAFDPSKEHVNDYADVMVKERIPEVMFLPVAPKGIKALLKGWLK